MKKFILLFSLFFITTEIYSQKNQMTSVFGISLGLNREEVKKTLLSEQPESKVYSEGENSITFQDVRWGEYKTFLVILQFSDEGLFHTAMIFLEPNHCKNVFDLYDDVTRILNDKYYQTQKTTEYYHYPYDRADKYKYTESMVKNDKVIMQSLWSFDCRYTPNNKEDDNNLTVKVSDDCLVIVTYQDGVIIDEVVQKNKSKHSKDY